MRDTALIIFVKNPIPGKVKTRLAKSIGNERAVDIYLRLLQHTASITKHVEADKHLFYGDYVNEQDMWDNETYIKKLQKGTELGERMESAFKEVFTAGYRKVLIIGSDCADLKKEILEQACAELEHTDIVAGPTFDGGYYLLGMKQLHPILFADINWSTPQVMNQTLAAIQSIGLQYTFLPKLSDVDEIKDVPTGWL